MSQLPSPTGELPDNLLVPDEIQHVSKIFDNLSVRTATVYCDCLLIGRPSLPYDSWSLVVGGV